MGSQEATSKLRPPSEMEFSRGTDTLLVRIDRGLASLFILSGDQCGSESRAFRSGDFTVRMVRLVQEPVCMVNCGVGDHLWMVAKDSLVIRVGGGLFVFAQPGFLYGLALPCGCTDKEAVELEDVFTRFCNYVDPVGKRGINSGKPHLGFDSCWRLCSKFQGFGSESTKFGIPGSERKRHAGVPESAQWDAVRAVRMSATVKLVSRALLCGTLDPKKHLNLVTRSVADTNTSCYNLSMCAMDELLAAVEAGSMWAKRESPSRQAVHGFWRFNRQGLMLLLKVLSFYTRAAVRMVMPKRPRLDTIAEAAVAESESDASMVMASGPVAAAAAVEMVASSSSCCGGAERTKMMSPMESCG